MDEIKVPIYLMTGFLESGKTSFLSFTIQQDYFHTDGKTLLILCEEGEEEYDPAILEANNTVVGTRYEKFRGSYCLSGKTSLYDAVSWCI